MHKDIFLSLQRICLDRKKRTEDSARKMMIQMARLQEGQLVLNIPECSELLRKKGKKRTINHDNFFSSQILLQNKSQRNGCQVCSRVLRGKGKKPNQYEDALPNGLLQLTLKN